MFPNVEKPEFPKIQDHQCYEALINWLAAVRVMSSYN